MKDIALILSFVFFFIGCADPTIIVTKEVNETFKIPNEIQIKTYNTEWERKKNQENKSFSEIGFPEGTTVMDMFICDALKPINVKESYHDTNVIIECYFNYGHCYPYIGRHFEIYFSAITYVNMKIVNSTGDVYGEAEYKGAWHRMPMDELMAKMIGAILKMEIPLESHSLNRDDIKLVKVRYAPKPLKQ